MHACMHAMAMLRRFRKRQSRGETLSAVANKNIVQAIYELLCEEEQRTRLAFDKAAPLVNNIFSALGNHDVRFEFDSLSVDDVDCHCERISSNEYNLLCSLKQLPNEDMRVQGKECDGAFTVRLSRNYEESCDQVSWEDICLPANSSGCRFFSTTKLLKVLMTALKHAIEDALSVTVTAASGAKAKCRMRNDLIVLDVKVAEERLSFNLLPSIQLNRETIKGFTLDTKITKVSKHLKITNTECIYLVAKPVLDYPEELWRLTVNNIENKFLSKMKATAECASHCLFAVGLLNEQYFASVGETALPYYYIRLAYLAEFLKYPHENYWKVRNFTERVESILLRLETNLHKGQFKNVFTEVNILGRREGENLTELSSHVGRLRSQFRNTLLNLVK